MDLPGTESRVFSWEQLVAELHSREIIPVRDDVTRTTCRNALCFLVCPGCAGG